jgi:hypothetical protein
MTPIYKKFYELFADKTLSEGCLISWNKYIDGSLSEDIEYVICYKKSDQWFSQCEHCIASDWNEYAIYWIFWHEPQLHDVFRVNREKYDWYMEVSDFRLRQTRWWVPLWQEVPYNPCLPLLQQEESTKEQIISLFS